MATCFDSIESSSGFPKNRSNVSKFIVHSGIPNAYSVRDPRMHLQCWYNESVLWNAWWLNTVETCCHKNILCNKWLCLTEIYTLYESRSSYPSTYHALSKLHKPCTVKQHPAYFLQLSLLLTKRRMACRLGITWFTNERKSYPESPHTIHITRKKN